MDLRLFFICVSVDTSSSGEIRICPSSRTQLLMSHSGTSWGWAQCNLGRGPAVDTAEVTSAVSPTHTHRHGHTMNLWHSTSLQTFQRILGQHNCRLRPPLVLMITAQWQLSHSPPVWPDLYLNPWPALFVSLPEQVLVLLLMIQHKDQPVSSKLMIAVFIQCFCVGHCYILLILFFSPNRLTRWGKTTLVIYVTNLSMTFHQN